MEPHALTADQQQKVKAEAERLLAAGEWRTHTDPNGRPYFSHKATKQTVRDLEKHLAQVAFGFIKAAPVKPNASPVPATTSMPASPASGSESLSPAAPSPSSVEGSNRPIGAFGNKVPPPPLPKKAPAPPPPSAASKMLALKRPTSPPPKGQILSPVSAGSVEPKESTSVESPTFSVSVTSPDMSASLHADRVDASPTLLVVQAPPLATPKAVLPPPPPPPPTKQAAVSEVAVSGRLPVKAVVQQLSRPPSPETAGGPEFSLGTTPRVAAKVPPPPPPPVATRLADGRKPATAPIVFAPPSIHHAEPSGTRKPSPKKATVVTPPRRPSPARPVPVVANVRPNSNAGGDSSVTSPHAQPAEVFRLLIREDAVYRQTCLKRLFERDRRAAPKPWILHETGMPQLVNSLPDLPVTLLPPLPAPSDDAPWTHQCFFVSATRRPCPAVVRLTQRSAEIFVAEHGSPSDMPERRTPLRRALSVTTAPLLVKSSPHCFNVPVTAAATDFDSATEVSIPTPVVLTMCPETHIISVFHCGTPVAAFRCVGVGSHVPTIPFVDPSKAKQLVEKDEFDLGVVMILSTAANLLHDHLRAYIDTKLNVNVGVRAISPPRSADLVPPEEADSVSRERQATFAALRKVLKPEPPVGVGPDGMWIEDRTAHEEHSVIAPSSLGVEYRAGTSLRNARKRRTEQV
jgi:hypothetical protein